MATLRDNIEYHALRVLLRALSSVSFSTAAAIGQAIGQFLFDVVGLRRAVTLDNLRRAFPKMDDRQLTALARRTYRNFGVTLAEFARTPRLGVEGIRRRAPIENRDVLEWVRRHGKGGIVVTGHFGNWEWLGATIQAHGYDLRPIAAFQRNPLVDRLIDEIRASVGVKVIKVGPASVRHTLRILRRNGFVGILFDQDAGRNGQFVQFFGRPASTPRGPAVFHLKTGAPIVMGIPRRLAPGKYLMRLEPLDFSHLEGSEEEKIQAITQGMTRRLEEIIRGQPDHWFWMHRRWKSSHLAPAHLSEVADAA